MRFNFNKNYKIITNLNQFKIKNNNKILKKIFIYFLELLLKVFFIFILYKY